MGVRTREETDDQGARWSVWELTEVRTLPEEWGLIAGDMIHNTRCALDHLVCALVELNGKPIEHHHQFPIYGPAPPADMTRMRKRVEGMDSVYAQRILDMQPYRDPASDRSKRLARLAMLDNADKHKVVEPAITALMEVQLGAGTERREPHPPVPTPSFLPSGTAEIARKPSASRWGVTYKIGVAFADPAVGLRELGQIHANAVSIVEGFAPAFV